MLAALTAASALAQTDEFVKGDLLNIRADATLIASMPNRMKHLLAEKEAKFYVIDANKLAAEAALPKTASTFRLTR